LRKVRIPHGNRGIAAFASLFAVIALRRRIFHRPVAEMQ
jgi:hypothetical protein